MKIEFVIVWAEKTTSFEPEVDGSQNRSVCRAHIVLCESLGKLNLAQVKCALLISQESILTTPAI